jgi:PKD repeat protein
LVTWVALRRIRWKLVLTSLWVAMFLIVAGVMSGQVAHAAPYGEVGHYGCYLTKLCEPEPQFGYPVGFAVAAQETDAVYVLDQLGEAGESGKLQYRLQKLASPGAEPPASPGEQLGEVIGEEEEYDEVTQAHPLIGLAVDGTKHRIYALVESIVEGSGADAPVADELIAWSTKPVKVGDENRLQSLGAGYEEDPVLHASVIARFEPGSANTGEDLYAPEAITVEESTGDVVIEAQQGVQNGLEGGPAVLKRIDTASETTIVVGAGEGEEWSAVSDPDAEAPDGLAAGVNETLAVDLKSSREEGAISKLLSVPSGEGFGKNEQTPLPNQEVATNHNNDEALALNLPVTVNWRNSADSGRTAFRALLEPEAAGSPIAVLTNGDYAVLYGKEHGPNRQLEDAEGWGGLEEGYFWAFNGNAYVGNIGVRIINPASGEIVTTVGGGEPGSCNIGTVFAAVAAGAKGTIFVMTQPVAQDGDTQDEVIEFAEGATKAVCPKPTGEITVNGQATEGATVKQGAAVQFSALSIDRAGETPFEFDWNFEGEGFVVGSKIEEGSHIPFSWPNPTAEHEYKEAGTYKAELRVVGDYGASTFPVTITVEPSEPPVAIFTGPTHAKTKEVVAFNGAESKGTPSSKNWTYIWEVTDEAGATTFEPEQSPELKYEFASPGHYKVRLTLAYEIHRGQTAEVTSEPAEVVVEEEAHSNPGSSNTGSSNTGSSNTSNNSSGNNGPPPPGKGVLPVKVAVSSRAHLLEAALKKCEKLKPRHKRVLCEEVAHKRYGPHTKGKRKKK